MPARDGLPAQGVAHPLMRVPPVRWPMLRALSLYRRIEGPRRLARLERSTRPLRIVVGSEGRAEPGWIATEHEYLDVADASHWQRFFAKGSIDAILAEHRVRAPDARVLRQADWDPAQGRIQRSVRFDTKPRGGFRYSSVILDAVNRC